MKINSQPGEAAAENGGDDEWKGANAVDSTAAATFTAPKDEKPVTEPV